MTLVLGFDLSLTAPAAVALPIDWQPGDWTRVKHWLHKPIVPKTGDDRGQLERYLDIARWAGVIVEGLSEPARSQCRFDADASNLRVYVENYGYSKNNANASRIMESGGVVKAALYGRFGIVMTPVSSSEARKLLLGFNPRKPKHDAKVEVQSALFNKAGAPKTWDGNVCDAFVCVNLGCSNLGGTALTFAAGALP